MRRLTILLAALGALLLVPAASAFAEELPGPETFGSAAQPSLTHAAGMAVDQSTGDLLAIEFEGVEPGPFTGVLRRFKPNGEPDPFSALEGSNKIDGSGGADAVPGGEILTTFLNGGNAAEAEVAVDNSGGPRNGDIYATNESNGRVDIFAPSGAYLTSLTESSEGPLAEPCGVAVDSSGNAYVADFSAHIHKFNSAGTGIANLEFAGNCTLAAGAGPTNGFIFAAHFGGETERLNSSTGAEGEYVVDPSDQDVGLAVDPASGHLFVGAGGTIKEFDASGASPGEVTSTPTAAVLQGLAAGRKARSLYASETGDSHVEVYALPKTGPTNRRTLTVTKSPSPSAGTGVGTVKSKPKGINCATACDEAVASLYKETTVLISAKAATGSTLLGWEGCESTTVISATEGTCTVSMTEDQEVEAQFGGTSKAIPNPQELTVSKGESSGFGTVKSKPAGVACEADCTKAAALYAGELTEPKPKAATTVILTEAKAPGSVFSGWSGCDEVNGEGQCVVAMSEAKEVTAEFTALPKNTLSVAKSPSPSAGTGLGTVKSKPKGINCASACSEAQASFAEDTTVVLAAKAATGSTLAGWEGCESTTVISATEGTCTVAMGEAQSVTAEFGGASKAIPNPQELTLAKAGTGFGTVKSKPGGIACEALCTATTALYAGELTEPKPKAASTVILTATSAPGSKPVEWSGCDEVNGEGQCVVSMTAAKEVTASFDELE